MLSRCTSSARLLIRQVVGNAICARENSGAKPTMIAGWRELCPPGYFQLRNGVASKLVRLARFLARFSVFLLFPSGSARQFHVQVRHTVTSIRPSRSRETEARLGRGVLGLDSC